MNQALPRGMGALFAGGMEACWMAGGLWLLEARASPDALPVLRLLLGLPLAFTLWRFTRALTPSLRLSAGLAGGAAGFIAAVGRHGPFGQRRSVRFQSHMGQFFRPEFGVMANALVNAGPFTYHLRLFQFREVTDDRASRPHASPHRLHH